MKFVGDISYSIYLLHFLVLCVIAKAFALVHLELNTVVMTLLLAAVVYAVTIPLAWVSYVYVEQPGVHLGKAVVRRHIANMSLERQPALRPASVE
jgi:peptidoglycan/LPS O-acetylase OafA/YrhL